MIRLLIYLCIFTALPLFGATSLPSQNVPDFTGFTRRILVSLSPEEIHYIFSDTPDGARPNYNWSLAFGRTSLCTIDEVEKIKNELGEPAFSRYGELINFGWLYDQKQFEYPLRKFRTLIKKDKSSEARVIEHVIDRALLPENIERQKIQIENEIERNEKRLSLKSGLPPEKVRELTKQLARKYNNCLGRYQTGFINITLQLLER